MTSLRAPSVPIEPMRSRPLPTRLTFAILVALSAPAAAIEVDGRIDPAEWQGAQHVTDFKVTQPLTGAAPAHLCLTHADRLSSTARRARR